MWADGKLIRGPKETLVPDANTHSDKIGGINYPDKWVGDTDEPSASEVAWSFNPDLNPSIDDTAFFSYVEISPGTWTYLTITEGEATTLIETTPTTVYYRDYNPVYASVAYNAEPISDGDDATLARTMEDYPNLFQMINDWSNRAFYRFSGAENVTVYRGTDDQEPDADMAFSAGIAIPAYINRAHIAFKTFQLEPYGNRIPSMSFEVVQGSDITSKAVIEDVLGMSDLSSAQWDTSGVSEVGDRNFVMGYTISRVTSYRQALEKFIDAFNIDCAEIGDKLVFRAKARTPDYTIPWADLAAAPNIDTKENALTSSIKDQLELPKELIISYKDPDRTYNTNTARFSRQHGRSRHKANIEFAIVRPYKFMKELARDKARRLWIEGKTIKIYLSYKYFYLAPSDIVTIDGSEYGKDDYTLKVATINRGVNGILEVEGVLNSPYVYDEVSGETTDIGSPIVIQQPTPNYVLETAVTLLLDIPALSPSDNVGNNIYWVTCGSSDDWVGTNLYRETFPGGDQYANVANNGLSSPIGEVTADPLPAWSGKAYDPNLSMTVTLYSSDEILESCTVDEFFNYANTAWVGGEIIQFKEAVSLGSNQYRLTGIRRGLRDTMIDSVMSGHALNEKFVKFVSSSRLLA